MSLSHLEQGSTGFSQRFFDLVSNVAVHHRLPAVVHAMIREPHSGKIFGAFVTVMYPDDGSDQATLKGDKFHELDVDNGGTVFDIASVLAKRAPHIPLLLEPQLFEQLDPLSVTWIEEALGHAKLVGIEGSGTLTVYIPYKAQMDNENKYCSIHYFSE